MRFAPAFIFLGLVSCVQDAGKDDFVKDFGDWQANRVERLKSRNGWLNLAGLFWLEEGENTLGSDPSNSIVFPDHAPAFIGKYILMDGEISFTAHESAIVFHDSLQVHQLQVLTDRSGKPTLLSAEQFTWFIIERSPKYGIRLRDYEHPAVQEFHGIETYEPDKRWVIEAEFERFDEPKEIMIPTVIGTMEPNMCPGVLRFTVDGIEQELYPSAAGKGLFLVFADETSGLETYGGGRFLYIPDVGDGDHLTIDFNRAYNPPCAFTPFATCPLPPRENYLEVSVEAGEKFAGHS